ncbi:unnamed protein product, partial [Nesidiocoris tenuis]
MKHSNEKRRKWDQKRKDATRVESETHVNQTFISCECLSGRSPKGKRSKGGMTGQKENS